MKRSGFTLIEVITAIMIGSIVVLTMTVQFIANYRFQTAINNEVSAGREARLALHEMTNVLRFATNWGTVAQPPGVGESPPGSRPPLPFPLPNMRMANIKGGCVKQVPTTTIIWYGYSPEEGILSVSYNGFNGTYNVIARDVTAFSFPAVSGSSLPLSITIKKGQASPITVQTTLYPIGSFQ